jgi:hypothetical protein
VHHDRLGVVLKKAIYNYMHGMCIEDDVRRFFDLKVPRPTVKRDFVARALRTPGARAGGALTGATTGAG